MRTSLDSYWPLLWFHWKFYFLCWVMRGMTDCNHSPSLSHWPCGLSTSHWSSQLFILASFNNLLKWLGYLLARPFFWVLLLGKLISFLLYRLRVLLALMQHLKLTRFYHRMPKRCLILEKLSTCFGWRHMFLKGLLVLCLQHLEMLRMEILSQDHPWECLLMRIQALLCLSNCIITSANVIAVI